MVIMMISRIWSFCSVQSCAHPPECLTAGPYYIASLWVTEFLHESIWWVASMYIFIMPLYYLYRYMIFFKYLWKALLNMKYVAWRKHCVHENISVKYFQKKLFKPTNCQFCIPHLACFIFCHDEWINLTGKYFKSQMLNFVKRWSLVYISLSINLILLKGNISEIWFCLSEFSYFTVIHTSSLGESFYFLFGCCISHLHLLCFPELYGLSKWVFKIFIKHNAFFSLFIYNCHEKI